MQFGFFIVFALILKHSLNPLLRVISLVLGLGRFHGLGLGWIHGLGLGLIPGLGLG